MLTSQTPARADAAAFALVYHDYHQALYRYCRRILRDDEDAQDALQSAMERAFAALQGERREIEWGPWLFRIAHNEAMSIIRHRRPAMALGEQVASGTAVDGVIAQRDEWLVLRADLRALSERQRRALILRELDGLGHAEIAIALGCSPAAAKVAISEARRALRIAREGRETACADVRRELVGGDRRRWRSRAVRAHLRSCAGCREFRAGLVAPARGPRVAGVPMLPGACSLLRQLAAGASSAWSGAAAGIADLAGIKALAAVAAVAVAAGGTGAALRGGPTGPAPSATGAIAAEAVPPVRVSGPAKRVSAGAAQRPVQAPAPERRMFPGAPSRRAPSESEPSRGGTAAAAVPDPVEPASSHGGGAVVPQATVDDRTTSPLTATRDQASGYTSPAGPAPHPAGRQGTRRPSDPPSTGQRRAAQPAARDRDPHHETAPSRRPATPAGGATPSRPITSRAGGPPAAPARTPGPTATRNPNPPASVSPTPHDAAPPADVGPTQHGPPPSAGQPPNGPGAPHSPPAADPAAPSAQSPGGGHGAAPTSPAPGPHG